MRSGDGCRRRWKHPHVRGEDPIPDFLDQGHKETPPRAWGRPQHDAEEEAKHRNTPTCVGKTALREAVARAGWKHPHVRGEDIRRRLSGLKKGETPPRAWGRPIRFCAPVSARRNTPTCVGKTWQTFASPMRRWKHPHVRGEDLATRTRDDTSGETPPRAWGRLLRCQCVQQAKGNTPTCVGKTQPLPTGSSEPQKHPHVRGEDCTPRSLS